MKKTVRFKTDSTLAQQCYEQLQQEIVEGILKPGQKLKVMPITERFNIGQSPVREALSRLVAFGLVDIEENKGFRVANVSESDIRDTYHIFTKIENMALALAIEKGDENWQGEILAQLHKLSLIENNNQSISHTEWAEQNYNFHVALIAGCNSPRLLEIRRTLYMKFDRYCRMAFQLTKHKLSINHAEHKKLAQAVIKKDVKTATDLMIYHINGALEDIIQQFKDNDLI